MDIKAYNKYCLAQQEVTKTAPLDEKKLIYNVIGKNLPLTDIDIFKSIHFKCDLATAIQLREASIALLSGHHMHVDHGDTVQTAGSIADKQLLGVVGRW